MDIISEYEENNIRLRIVVDDDPLNPRTEWDNLGKMVCFHKRYNIGDKHNLTSSMFNSWDDLKEFLIKEHNAIIILPIYMLDHSGITIRTRNFSDVDPGNWDSGMIGFIYVSTEDIKKEFSTEDITEDIKTKAINILENEIKAYDNFLTGEVYGFMLEEKIICDKCNNIEYDLIDSCFGFYSDDFLKEVVECLEDKYKHMVYKLQ